VEVDRREWSSGEKIKNRKIKNSEKSAPVPLYILLLPKISAD
jgi:hypothetical protein